MNEHSEHRKQKRSKDHHYIPQGIQRKFSPNEKNIYYAQKAENGKFHAIDYKNVKTAFYVRDLYTVLEKGVLSDMLERGILGALDDGLSSLAHQLEARYSKPHEMRFTPEDEEELRLWMYYMMTRSPDMMGDITAERVGSELCDQLQSAGLTSGNCEVTDKLLGKDRVAIKHHGGDIIARTRLSMPSELITNELSKFSIRVALARKSSFILSSRGVLSLGRGSNGTLLDPRTELWMPVTPKIALVLVQKPAFEGAIVMSDEDIRLINSDALMMSSAVGSHSLRLLCSLTGQSYAQCRKRLAQKYPEHDIF